MKMMLIYFDKIVTIKIIIPHTIMVAHAYGYYTYLILIKIEY